MCTVLYLPWPRKPFLAAIGHNRDEAYSRPSAPPRWWPGGPGEAGFLAPQDLTAGGTWFGIAEAGLFVALTNGRPEQQGAFRHDRSRGELVVAALRRGHLDGALAALAALDATAFAPCHLLLAQGRRLAYVAPDLQGRFAATPLPPAAWALRNDGMADAATVFEARTGRSAILGALKKALTNHAGDPAVCRHSPTWGTCSSAVLLLGASLAESRLFFAAGRPCETAFHRIPAGSPAGVTSPATFPPTQTPAP